MSAETRERCEQCWRAYQATQGRVAEERQWWDELRPALSKLAARGIKLVDGQGREVTPQAEPDHRAEINLAFALKAHLLDEGTGWSPP
jgi:hypothetical protein